MMDKIIKTPKIKPIGILFPILAAFSVLFWTAPVFADTTDVPTAQATYVSGISATSAIFGGLINPNNQSGNYYFEYGPNGSFVFTTAPGSMGVGNYDRSVSVNVTNLQPGMSYSYRLVVQYNGGVIRSSGVFFTTLYDGNYNNNSGSYNPYYNSYNSYNPYGYNSYNSYNSYNYGNNSSGSGLQTYGLQFVPSNQSGQSGNSVQNQYQSGNTYNNNSGNTSLAYSGSNNSNSGNSNSMGSGLEHYGLQFIPGSQTASAVDQLSGSGSNNSNSGNSGLNSGSGSSGSSSGGQVLGAHTATVKSSGSSAGSGTSKSASASGSQTASSGATQKTTASNFFTDLWNRLTGKSSSGSSTASSGNANLATGNLASTGQDSCITLSPALDSDTHSATVSAGQEAKLLFTYRNQCGHDLPNAMFSMTLPAEAEFMSTDHPFLASNGGTLTYNLGNLTNGSSDTIGVRVLISKDTPAGASLIYGATLSYSDTKGHIQSVSGSASFKTEAAKLSASLGNSLQAFFGRWFVSLILICLILGLLIWQFFRERSKDSVQDLVLKVERV